MPFYRIEPAFPVSAGDAALLKKLLSDPQSYIWLSEQHMVRACLPDYGVLFTFHHPSKTVRIALCFYCDQMAVLVGEGDDPLRIDAEDVFDRIRAPLLILVKRLFPNDPNIQALLLQVPT